MRFVASMFVCWMRFDRSSSHFWCNVSMIIFSSGDKFIRACCVNSDFFGKFSWKNFSKSTIIFAFLSEIN
jgi:hypothetical protein